MICPDDISSELSSLAILGSDHEVQVNKVREHKNSAQAF